MNARVPTGLAGLSMVGLMGWLAAGSPDDGGVEPDGVRPANVVVLQEQAGGSEVPCAVPLAWRVARVDPEFEIDVPVVASIVNEATRLWEEASGHDLFVRDDARGFPIRLVYDERQARLAERLEGSSALDRLRQDLLREREELEIRARAHRDATAAYAARVVELDRRVEEHNEAVREWNQRSDRPDALWRQLQAAGEALRAAQTRIEAERPPLDAEQAAIGAAERDLNQRIAEYERLSEDLDVAGPPDEVEAGIYREAVTRQNGELVEVTREIRLYRFASPEELRLLAAHELGHALGLGHLGEPGAVMSASARTDEPVDAVSASDLELLRAVCPALGGAR